MKYFTFSNAAEPASEPAALSSSSACEGGLLAELLGKLKDSAIRSCLLIISLFE